MHEQRRPSTLVVDDDAATAHAIVTSLSGQGYDLMIASTVDEALDSLARGTFDCVLLDQRLFDASLLAELSRYPAQTIALIVLIGATDGSAREALQRGAYDYIEKPLDLDLLKVRVARALERTALARTMRELLEELQDRVDAARRQLANAYRERDEFIHVVAHELSGPLSAIEGYVEMLSDQVVPSEVQQRALASMSTATRRMARLIEDLAGSAHAPSVQLSLDLGEWDLVDIVQEQIALANADSVVASLPAEPVVARCDRDRIGQVVANLLSNALKYADARVHVCLERAPHEARLTIADSGPGIPRERLRDIFEPHVRLADPDTPRSGSGLGLYVARCIAEAHGGTLVAESNERGASFTVSLPLHGRRT